jgi:hypothetical protein
MTPVNLKFKENQASGPEVPTTNGTSNSARDDESRAEETLQVHSGKEPRTH